MAISRKKKPLPLERVELSAGELSTFRPQAVAPPVASRPARLPFDQLRWEVFENLAFRLAQTEGDVEHAARLGRAGQRQHGIDLFMRSRSGQYTCWQTKQWRTFKAKDIQDAIHLFEEGPWFERTTIFVICVSCLLQDTDTQELIEREAQRFRSNSKVLLSLDAQGFSDRLRDQIVLIDDFFGRDWVKAFLGPESVRILANRIDPEFANKLRHSLARDYVAGFKLLDPGVQLGSQDTAGSASTPPASRTKGVKDRLSMLRGLGA
jgi:hypothetical protein